MNLIETFQNLVAQVPELLQPLIVALAGAVPFIEGEGAVTIGIVGGIPPIIAAIAAVAGNLLCVAILVFAGARARSAVVERRRAKQTVAADGSVIVEGADAAFDDEPVSERAAERRAKLTRALDRYGVPGASLLGPLLLPTMFTATMLVALGIDKWRVLAWQAVAIIGWTTLLALVATGLIHAVA